MRVKRNYKICRKHSEPAAYVNKCIDCVAIELQENTKVDKNG